MGIYLLESGSQVSAVWPGAGITCSQGIPPDFYLPHVNMGLPVLPPPLCATLSLPTPSMRLDECGFFKFLVIGLLYSSIFWWFWVLFVLRSSCSSFCGCSRRWSMFTCACTLTGSLCLCFVKLATHTEPQASNFSSDNWYFECGWLNMGFSFSQYQCFTLSIRPSFLFGCISERVSYHMLAILPAKSHCYLTLASLMTVTGLFSVFR